MNLNFVTSMILVIVLGWTQAGFVQFLQLFGIQNLGANQTRALLGWQPGYLWFHHPFDVKGPTGLNQATDSCGMWWIVPQLLAWIIYPVSVNPFLAEKEIQTWNKKRIGRLNCVPCSLECYTGLFYVGLVDFYYGSDSHGFSGLQSNCRQNQSEIASLVWWCSPWRALESHCVNMCGTNTWLSRCGLRTCSGKNWKPTSPLSLMSSQAPMRCSKKKSSECWSIFGTMMSLT